MKKIIFGSLIAIMSTGFASTASAHSNNEDGYSKKGFNETVQNSDRREAIVKNFKDRRNSYKEHKGNMRDKMRDRRNSYKEHKGNMRDKMRDRRNSYKEHKGNMRDKMRDRRNSYKEHKGNMRRYF